LEAANLQPVWKEALPVPAESQITLVGGDLFVVRDSASSQWSLYQVNNKDPVQLPFNYGPATFILSPDRNSVVLSQGPGLMLYNFEKKQVLDLQSCPSALGGYCEIASLSVKFSPNSQRLILFAQEYWREWDLAGQNPSDWKKSDLRVVSSPVYSPDGKFYALIGPDQVVVIDSASQQIVKRQDHLMIYTNSSFQPQLSSDGQKITERSSNGYQVFDLDSGQPVEKSTCPLDMLPLCQRALDGSSWTTLDEFGQLLLVVPGQEPFVLVGAGGSDPVYIPPGLLTAGGVVIDTKTGKAILKLSDSTANVLAVSSDGLSAAIGSDSTIELYSIKEQTRMGKIQLMNEGQVKKLSYSPDGKMLAVATQQDIQFWQVADRTLQRAYILSGSNISIVNLTFSPDGKILVVVMDQETVFLDPKTAAEVYKNSYRWTSVAFLQDQTVLAAASQAGVVQFWKVP